jgi:hypothetical protein
MKTPVAIAIGVAAVVGAGVYMWSGGRDERATEKIGAGKAIVAAQTPIYQKAETLFVHDTVRLTRLVVQHDTILKEMRITDTVWVKNYIASSEATIQACKENSGGLCSCQGGAAEDQRGSTSRARGRTRSSTGPDPVAIRPRARCRDRLRRLQGYSLRVRRQAVEWPAGRSETRSRYAIPLVVDTDDPS